MDLTAKLLAGTLATVSVGGPGVYLTIKSLNPKSIKEQLEKDGITEIKSEETDKWNKKVNGKEQDQNLKKFIKDNKKSEPSAVSGTDLKEACLTALEKKTNEVNYEEFKKYCVEEKE